MRIEQRSERQSLEMMTGFDVCEQITVGSADFDPAAGTFDNVSGLPSRSCFYCRAIYNAGTTSLTVTFTLADDSTPYVAEIPSGQWHNTWANISSILAAGTDSGMVRLGYFDRGKVDGTGNWYRGSN
jgi:hypothetical protein